MENKKEKFNYNKVPKKEEVKEEPKVTEAETPVEKKEEVKAEPKPAKAFNGYVDSPLNLREAPKKDAKILTVIPGKSRVTVDTKEEVNGFYKVKFNEFDGFAMSQFIKIK